MKNTFSILFVMLLSLMVYSEDSIPNSKIKNDHIHGSSCNHGQNIEEKVIIKKSVEVKANREFKVFPEDTMQRFIEAYGKDSLVQIINNELNQTTRFLQKHWITLKLDDYNLPAILASRYYNLGIDTMSYYDEYNQFYFYYLYKQAYGDTSDLMKTIRTVISEIQKQDKTMRQFVLTLDSVDYTQKHTVQPTAMLCYLFEADGFCGEVVYNYFKDNEYSMNLEDKVKFMIYIAMALRDDNYKNFPVMRKNLEGILLQLYNEFTFEEVYKILFFESDDEIGFKDEDEILRFYFSITLNNYMLYSKLDYKIKLGKDLFYILNLPEAKEGSYTFLNQRSFDINVHYKIQIAWLLAQWKEHLSKN